MGIASYKKGKRMSFFDRIVMEPPDPILGLTSRFCEDSRSTKVNLGVGAYKTSELKPMVLSCVKKAEEELFNSCGNKEYLPISGNEKYLSLLEEVVFGSSSTAITEERICAAQMLGGTGALRVGADFLKEEVGDTIFLSDPSWANHKPLFLRAGLKVKQYNYYDYKTHSFCFEKMCESIKEMPRGSIILLQACCHNPTGIDPTFEQWKEISSVIKTQGVVPFFDMAYQGFGDGLEEDAAAIRCFVEDGHECLIAYSASKNFGLYGERVGALFVVNRDKLIAETALSKIKVLIRTNFSNPPLHGASIVRTVLSSTALTKKWHIELQEMRERVVEMRKALAAGLMAKSEKKDFSFMKQQKGMFSFSGLDRDEVDCLMTEFGIYMLRSGRINVAGLSQNNIDYVVDAILSVT